MTSSIAGRRSPRTGTGQWGVVPSPNPGSYANALSSVVVLAADNVWAVGNQNDGGGTRPMAMLWDGHAWNVVPCPDPNTSPGSSGLSSMAAISANDIWAAGSFHNQQTDNQQHRTLLEHWNGSSWAEVELAIFDVSGRRIRVIASGTDGPGDHVASWNRRDARGVVAPPGLYLARLLVNGRTVSSRPLTLLARAR